MIINWISPETSTMSEDISGRKQEKEERQIEESRLTMKQEESEDTTLSGDAQDFGRDFD